MCIHFFPVRCCCFCCWKINLEFEFFFLLCFKKEVLVAQARSKKIFPTFFPLVILLSSVPVVMIDFNQKKKSFRPVVLKCQDDDDDENFGPLSFYQFVDRLTYVANWWMFGTEKKKSKFTRSINCVKYWSMYGLLSFWWWSKKFFFCHFFPFIHFILSVCGPQTVWFSNYANIIQWW